MTKTIVFDMDGVLFDTERISKGCWEEIAIEMGLGDLSKGALDCVGLNLNDSKALMYRLYGDNFPYTQFHSAVRVLIREKIDQSGLPLKNGVMEILDFLREEGYKVGLASSTRISSVMEHLKESGITGYFKVIIGGDMVVHSKPEPDIYLKACERLGAIPGQTIAIEDSPNGIRAAYRAKMRPIMVPDLIEPDEEIEQMLFRKCSSLIQVMEYLRDTGG